MKKIVPWILSAMMVIPSLGMAQTFTFSTNTSPGITVSTNPFGTGVGVSTPYFNTVYTSDGYYDGYAHRKAMKKARKAYRKEMKKQYRKAAKHHYRHHHHHDD